MRIFNLLIGTWALKRNIVDHIGKSQLTGQCQFTKISDTQILCEEKGVLNYNGLQTEASRNYIYERREDKIFILYHDAHRRGDVLHELDFVTTHGKSVAEHCHECGRDTYHLQFQISADGHIRMDYVVKGPQKNYEMASRLIKIAIAPE